MTYREINIPTYVGPEAAYKHFDVRFTGALSEVESELAFGIAKGAATWCNAFRDIHDGDLAQRATVGMLKEFADDAPSPFLRGYVLGIMFSREKPGPLGMPMSEWAARANAVEDPEIRGMALACAVVAILLEANMRLTSRPIRRFAGAPCAGQSGGLGTTGSRNRVAARRGSDICAVAAVSRTLSQNQPGAL